MKALHYFYIIGALFIGTSLHAKRYREQCRKKDKSGACVKWTYWEDGYHVTKCKAPKNGTCKAVTKIGDKKAECTARNGHFCTAKVRGSL